ncbi:Fe(3+) ABC transporter substrate-binding protein [Chitinimonas arctica]|uniref:Fe(3+) ABC transporter substrate-binding protein n=1 Tax=Chitinimonas arctica TaxID=2594795 RepID=A0A516SIQ9_9NEIS|nr:Fe(3+) ABC transporter substrate-binding protein [Chitinimonas arctica]QDQ28031.1 Fe(3+) ABC transporter substrate-binding protein [Chitinimonas arctica]
MKFRPLLIVAALAACVPALAEEVTVYSARIEQLIKPLFDAYTKETGVQVKFVTGQEGPLMERLKAEGQNTPADLLLTVDAGNLWQAEQQGLLKPVKSAVLNTNVPAHLRDAAGSWYGLSIRARTIFYNTGKVKPADLSSYEDLASAKWKGRLCLRTAKKVYNQSLVGTMIARMGEPKTESIVRGWVANLAADPFSDDEALLKAIGAGQCDVGIANTYYYGRVMQRDPKQPIGIFWPNQKSSGVHVNISGAGVTRYAKHEAAAIRLLEWLSSDKAQNLYADVNMEYPVNPKVKPDERVAAWGDFKHDFINVAKAGELQSTAVKLMDRAGYR